MNKLINISQETTITLQVNYRDLIVKAKFDDAEKQIPIKGILIRPNWTEIIPSKFCAKRISKYDSEEERRKIEEELLKGIYYLNVKDYSEQELKIACDFLTKQWTDEISSFLSQKEENKTISLQDEVVLKHILEQNIELFKNEEDSQIFCDIYSIKVKYFKFSILDLKLKEIIVRLEMEQLFAKRYLFTESLLRKLNNRLKEDSRNNEIN